MRKIYILLAILALTMPDIYGMGMGGGSDITCGTGTTLTGNTCKADITTCGTSTTLTGKTCKADITECGDGTTLTDKICIKDYDPRTTHGPPSTGVAPHMSGGHIFQGDIDIITANPNTIQFIFDMGSELHVTMKTVDNTLYVIYRDSIIAHIDTGLCSVVCPDRPQEFRFVVQMPTPPEPEYIQNGNWLYMCEVQWNPLR